MDTYKIFYRGNLPHYQPAHHIFFVTFRLYQSIPHEILSAYKTEYKVVEQQLLKTMPDPRIAVYNLQKKYFARFDRYLDQAQYGPTWLAEDAFASIVASSLHYVDRKLIWLLSYTILPNHVHTVFSIHNGNTPLFRIMQRIKAFTGNRCQALLGYHGQFWQRESYDHCVRGNDELVRIIRYVMENPVKANLCEKGQEWKWSYVAPEVKNVILK